MTHEQQLTEVHKHRRIVAVLSEDPRLQRVVEEAVRDLAADVTKTEDPDEAAKAGEQGAAVWIVDSANPRLDLDELHRVRSAGPLLVVLSPQENLPDDADPTAYYLARPLQSRTLAALCEQLLGELGTTGAAPTESTADEDLGPQVSARAPALFKSRTLYAEASRFVEAALEAVRAGRKPRVSEARVLAEKIHTALLQSNRLLLMALEPYERFELSLHSVNVALLAGKVSMGLGWGVDGVLRAIQAGLLHDIGMARLPEWLLEKQGKLSDEEWDMVRQHPSHGAEIIGGCGEEFEWLQRAVAQEHERMNGQGYPDGLSGEQIDDLARVVAVADVFEAFSHPRTYRSLFTSYEALEQVVGLRDESLSGDVVAALVDEISAFPLDSFVLLSTGEIGRVVGTNPTNLMRPVVRTVWDPLWQPVGEPRTLDLSEETTVSVSRPLHETELPIT